MSGLLILGAGGHGRVILDTALALGRWDEIAFLDDAAAGDTEIDGVPVLGPFAAAAEVLDRYPTAVPALGDNALRLATLGRLQAAGFELPVLIHPSAAVSDRTTLGVGTVVFAQCAINCGSVLGRGCIVNTGTTVDHDARLGAGVHLSPGVHVGGEVAIGDRTWLGVGVNVRNRVTIGADVVVGVGAAVVSDLPDGVTATGVPARIIEG